MRKQKHLAVGQARAFLLDAATSMNLAAVKLKGVPGFESEIEALGICWGYLKECREKVEKKSAAMAEKDPT